jgi:hypothetical protein
LINSNLQLLQTIALLQSNSITDFLDPDLRELAYPRVQSKKLSFMLVKLITYYNAVMGSPRSQMIDPKYKRDMVREDFPMNNVVFL